MTLPIIDLPGYFYSSTETFGEENADAYTGKIIVLVDERTQSMGEYLTMCVQAVPGSVVVGSQTAGADGNIAWISLPGDAEAPIGHGYIKISGLGVFYPDGAPTQRIGVRIDHRVAPTIEGVKAGRDEVLEKALEIIGKN